MDTRTGNIFSNEQIDELGKYLNDGGPKPEWFAKMAEKERPRYEDLKPMKVAPTPRQMRRKKIGRNEPCPCGSGKKFKRCCLNTAL